MNSLAAIPRPHDEGGRLCSPGPAPSSDQKNMRAGANPASHTVAAEGSDRSDEGWVGGRSPKLTKGELVRPRFTV